MAACPGCGKELTWVPQYGQWYCYAEQKYYQPGPAQPTSQQPAQAGGLWFQNWYKIRKKVLALTNQYWIEDAQGRQLAYSKQKAFKIKEDIRVFTDERMAQELFRIQQLNWTDAWGEFGVVDTATNQSVGFVRRKALASIVRSEWEIYDQARQLMGGIYEQTGRALLRRFVPGGALVPQKVIVTLRDQPVATIDQQFKMIGDEWGINCQWAPPQFDRRVLLSCALLMGMIERPEQR
ncbi:MAG: hypothetical protein HY557_03735 [Euryarchaeota archaeon]|nr:hypothetical protein [Euryarchaeota archaeon]